MGTSKLGQTLTATFLLACGVFTLFMIMLVVQQLPRGLASEAQSPALRLMI